MAQLSMEAIPSLGPLDADDDQNLNEYFVSFGRWTHILKQTVFLVVGPKGTGKSAIKKRIEDIRKTKKDLFIDLNDAYGFSLNELTAASAAEIKGKMKGYLTAVILQYLLERNEISAAQKKTIRDAIGERGALRKFFEKAVSPLKLKALIAEYAVGELFKRQGRSELLGLAKTEVTSAITEALGTRDLWIVIDDIDSIFTSGDPEASLRFVEGLLYAVSDLNNNIFHKFVWIIVLIKTEIFEELTRKAPELDKEDAYIWEINWDSGSLKSVLAERVRWALNKPKDADSENLLQQYFECSTKTQLKQLLDYLIERSTNGPRDLLMLVELARQAGEKAGASKIAMSHVKSIERIYGEKKVKQINANFKRVYPEIDKVIERLFRGAARSYTRSALEVHIRKMLLEDTETREDFKDVKWLRFANAFSVIKALYQVGLLGCWNASTGRNTYSIEISALDTVLTSDAKFNIHNAFSAYLELR